MSDTTTNEDLSSSTSTIELSDSDPSESIVQMNEEYLESLETSDPLDDHPGTDNNDSEQQDSNTINDNTNNNNSHGHVFIAFSSLPQLACDAWVLPSTKHVYIGRDRWLGHVDAKKVKQFCFNNFPAHLWGLDGLRVYKLDRWSEVDPHASQPWLVLAASNSKCPAAWYAEGIKQFLTAVAEDLEGTTPRNGRERHLVAVPVVGTGYGGGRLKSGLILKGIIRELFHATRLYNYDVALVTNQREMYAAALHERALYDNAFSLLGPRLTAEADKLVRYAQNDKLVVFVGAGCSAAAGMPMWGTLLSDLEVEAGIVESERKHCEKLPFVDRAHFVQQRLEQQGRSLQAEISKRLDRKCYALAHAMLATLPVKEYITTNYDTLLEYASSAIEEKLRVLPYEPEEQIEENSVSGSSKWLLKMHGCIRHEDDIVLTREHYLRYNDRNQALAGIVQSMLMTKHMMFCGFSLSDDNFFSIVSTVRKAIRSHESTTPFGTSLNLTNNPVVAELWKKDVNMVHMTESSLPQGARLIEIYLDYICSKSFTAIDHLFCPEYDSVLSSSDVAFRDAMIRFLHTELPPDARESKAYRAFKASMVKTFDAESLFSEDERLTLMNDLTRRSKAPNHPKYL